MIDVGGPSMLRGAAKNFAHCAPLSRPERYGFVLDELRNEGALSIETRRELASEAFATTAAYEAAIATWFADREAFPETLVLPLEKVLDLSYGENPHQRAAYYAERGSRSHLLSRVEQLHGKALSFNNLNDLSAARLLAREFALPACVIVKHANPCGVAIGATVDEAYDKALASDPTSAYGGIVVLNREVDGPLGEKLAEQFVEVLFAPDYDEAALSALTRKQGTRILVDRERRRVEADLRHYKRVLGGLLVQDPDTDIEDREGWQVACGTPDERQWGDLVFAWRVCKHVSSNAIVLVRDLATIGIGAGQMSRVDAVRIAVEKAAAHGHDIAGAGARIRCVLPLPRRAAHRARRRGDLDRPARRLEARPGRDRRGGEGRRDNGLHRAASLPPLTTQTGPAIGDHPHALPTARTRRPAGVPRAAVGPAARGVAGGAAHRGAARNRTPRRAVRAPLELVLRAEGAPAPARAARVPAARRARGPRGAGRRGDRRRLAAPERRRARSCRTS